MLTSEQTTVEVKIFELDFTYIHMPGSKQAQKYKFVKYTQTISPVLQFWDSLVRNLKIPYNFEIF